MRRLVVGVAALTALQSRCVHGLSTAHWACPSCSEPLLLRSGGGSASTFRCTHGHVYDVAREGHIHLLPPKRKAPAAAQEEVDDMVRAQRAFYEGGGFDLQVDGLAAEVWRALCACPEAGRREVLGSGCGEGAYMRQLGALAAACGGDGADGTSDGLGLGLWGIDDAKLAVRYAAKRQRQASFAVASAHRLPFAAGSLDLVFSVFGQAPWEEFCRVLRPGGAVVVARAGPEHLIELKRTAAKQMNTLDPKAGAPKQFAAGLAENYVRVRSEAVYSAQMADNLLRMTPSLRGLWRDAPDKHSALRQTAADGVTVDLIISTHRVWLGTGGEPD